MRIAVGEGAFGGDVDYVVLHKIYGNSPESAKGKYSPAECVGTQKHCIEGDRNLKHVSTSFVECSNLTMRMHNRRFTSLTNAFSKKFDRHVHMVAIWTVWYNWVRIHKSLRVTPAMASGLTDRIWNFEEIVAGMDAIAPKAGRPKTYKMAQIAWKLRLWNYLRVANLSHIEVYAMLFLR